ncbi:hypothetical protein [Dechloromonas sp. A34]|uniref:hypothetical protein n=1 Tax=Dechloromonas sp. A34 TaxID=447588 RepID=UPI002248C87B|nr:hypothetical protein [Dechloromonas sp. A34]
MKKVITVALAGAFALSLAACGEYSQVASYKPGSYQGKSDTRPWEGGKFAGDKPAWEAALANRAQGQNEYKRAQ